MTGRHTATGLASMESTIQHIGPAITPADIGTTEIVGAILSAHSRAQAVRVPGVLKQYLSQRAEAARDAVPRVLASRQAAIDAASNSKVLKREEAPNERAKLFIRTNLRRVYFPGQTVEAVLAADQAWCDADASAEDGFAELTLTFEGVITSWGSENVSAATKKEANVLFREQYTLKAPPPGLASVGRRSSSSGGASGSAGVSASANGHGAASGNGAADGSAGAGESLTGLTVTPIESIAAPDGEGHGASSRLKAWHMRAVFPEVVHSTRMAGSNNLMTKRKEHHTLFLPPVFRDDKTGGPTQHLEQMGINSVLYRITLTGRRIGKNAGPPSWISQPLLFLPFAPAPPPSLSLDAVPAYSHELAPAPSSTDTEAQFATLSCREKIRKGFVTDKYIVTAKVILPRPMHVPPKRDVPFSIVITVSAKDAKDLEDGASALPTLPLSGAQESWPILYYKRVESSKAGWANELITTFYPATLEWSRGHLATNAANGVEAHGWTPAERVRDATGDKDKDKDHMGRWARSARVTGTLSNILPPPVNAPSLTVDYQLHFSYKVASSAKLSGFVTDWISSTGVDPHSGLARSADEATRVALGADYATLRSVADPAIGSTTGASSASSGSSAAAPAARASARQQPPGDALPTYESSSRSAGGLGSSQFPQDVKEALPEA